MELESYLYFHSSPSSAPLGGLWRTSEAPLCGAKENRTMSASPSIIAIVGLPGAGKSEVANYFVQKGFSYLRFGQITLDEIKRRGLAPTEANERQIREELRQEHGMAAFAKLNMPTIDEFLSHGKQILIDGLYSWSEYKLLKEKYGHALTVVAVYAPPEMRYARLENRHKRHGDDPNVKYRSLSREEALARDYAQIENIEQAGPIAMADFTIVNTGTLEDLKKALDQTHQTISI
jgi:dephospho-CoA kinase